MKFKLSSNNHLLKTLTSLSLIATTLFITQAASATELVIQDNGSGADGDVVLNNSSTTTVSQSSTASITNNITTDANTGGNTASGNTDGDSSITTGDVTTTASVTNISNVSAVNTPCCQESSSSNMTISGNGSDSQNSINTDLFSSTQIQVDQEAFIKNSISQRANTGSNTASDNTGGSASIFTGNITISDHIKNHHINISGISGSQGVDSVIAGIFGNGADSENNIDVTFENNFKVLINSLASISNTLDQNANTGGNTASNNSGGEVLIATGDITIDNAVDNGPINLNTVDIGCCHGSGDPSGGDTNNIPQPAPASSSSSSGSSSGSGSGGSGGVLAAAITTAGQVLPATGAYWTLLLTFLSSLMFAIGLYLRLHPGQDPGRQLALAY